MKTISHLLISKVSMNFQNFLLSDKDSPYIYREPTMNFTSALILTIGIVVISGKMVGVIYISNDSRHFLISLSFSL